MEILKYAWLSIITIGLGYSASVSAQTLAEEQVILDKLQTQSQNLSALSVDLTNNLNSVNQQISDYKAKHSSPEYSAAEAALEKAKEAQASKPSAMNSDKLEMANFKYALAHRKYKKNNPALFAYLKQQEELSRALDTNKAQIGYNQQQQQSQTELINTLLKEEELGRQAWLAKQANKQAEQDKANDARTAAIAKAAQLRAQIKQQQEQQKQALSKESQ